MAAECSECRKIFPQKQRLNRHMLTHTWEKSFECVECGKKFAQRLMLKKHMFTHAGEKPFVCSECGDKFIVRQDFEAHKLIHSGEKQVRGSEFGEKVVVKREPVEQEVPDTREKPVQCVWLVPDSGNINVDSPQRSPPSCETSLSVTFMTGEPKDKVESECRCDNCGNVYSTNKSLKRHLKTCGNVGSLNKTKCLHPTCDRKFFHITKMIHHLENDHSGMNVNAKEINFTSLDDFKKWKEEEEVNTYSYFSRNCGKTRLKGGVYNYYTCQHDGSERFHCRSGEAGRTTNRRWAKGRVKTGITCPSRMLVKEYNTGAISVKYISTHNHEVKFENVKYQPLPSSTLQLVKQQLALGVSPRKIQEKLRDGISDEHDENDVNQASRRIHFVSLKQLNELRRKLKMNSRIQEVDAASVASLVKNFEGYPVSPFITYKPQDGPVVIGDSELDDLPDAKDLFAVGLQTEQQMRIMRDGVERLLYLDFFHFDNDNEFTLLNLIVPDESGNCYPVAHFITNRKDEKTLRCLFSSLRERCPSLRIEAVMTDGNAQGVCALKTVFGYMRTLMCQKQIRKSWVNRLGVMVNDDAMRREMLSALDRLLLEKDEEYFQHMCSSFIGRYSKVFPDFVYYFKKFYLNSPQVWADCYRILPDTLVDPDTFCLLLHNRLRSFHYDKKHSRKISDLLLLLLEAEKETVTLYEQSFKCGITSVFPEPPVNDRHARGLQIPNGDVTMCEGVWKVMSQHNTNTYYVVTCSAEDCRQDFCFEKCTDVSCAGLCAHLFTCSCRDVSGLCKHIHKIRSLTVQDVGTRHRICHKQEEGVYCELKQEVLVDQEEEMYTIVNNNKRFTVNTEDVYTTHLQDVYTTETTEIYCTQDQNTEDVAVHDDNNTQVEDIYTTKLRATYHTAIDDVCCSQAQATGAPQTENDLYTPPQVPKVGVELRPVASRLEVVGHCEVVTSHIEAAVLQTNDMTSLAGIGVEHEEIVSHVEGMGEGEDVLP
ncbi:uncharacterized protein LOC121876440 [Homarus americanus]|uniref:uncharacterized protein LOC121876440 n=1 Tax=Homarus americanus TaxID=6706 RepID=UPI001C488A9E|nr:uncharacterized protein LOC121876440 [Homarus americanus]